MDRRAIEELSATISVSSLFKEFLNIRLQNTVEFNFKSDNMESRFLHHLTLLFKNRCTAQDLEFRIRMGIVSDEYTEEYCNVAHQILDQKETDHKKKVRFIIERLVVIQSP